MSTTGPRPALWLMAAAVICPLAAGQSTSAGNLFEPVGEHAKDPFAGEPCVASSQAVKIGAGWFERLGKGEPDLLEGATVQLSQDCTVKLVFEEFERCPMGGFIWRGRIEDVPLSRFVLSVYEESMVGEFHMNALIEYQIRCVGEGLHFIRAIDMAKAHIEDAVGPAEPAGDGVQAAATEVVPTSSAAGGAVAAGVDPVTIDVLIVYTPGVRNRYGGTAGTYASLNNYISDTNVYFENSLIPHRLRLVGRHETDYATTGDFTVDLAALRGQSDGDMDEIHGLRNEVGADVVSLLVDGSMTGIVGLGNRVASLSGFHASAGFSMISINTATATRSFAHELGHNLGCHHHPDDASPLPPSTPARDDLVVYPYAFAWRFGTWPVFYRTVMAYDHPVWPHIVIPYFSTPDVSYGGQPCGVTDEIDNGRVIEQTARLVAAYKPTVLPHADAWVDVDWNGAEHGTWAEPFNSVSEGVVNVPVGGLVVFKPGSVPARISIGLSVTLKAFGGDMIIGQ